MPILLLGPFWVGGLFIPGFARYSIVATRLNLLRIENA